MSKACLALIALCLLVGRAPAGRYNDKLNVGDPAPAWSNLPGTDDRKHSLDDLKDKELVVVVFTCCSCPVAVDYEDRIIAFAKKYEGKVAVLAINVNNIEEDRLPAMKARAQQKSFPFPYLYDETQKIARAYGAENTPGFFLLDRQRRVAYMGAMDDQDDATKVKEKFLEEAVNAVLKGEKPRVQETWARGCAIRWQRKRRAGK